MKLHSKHLEIQWDRRWPNFDSDFNNLGALLTGLNVLNIHLYIYSVDNWDENVHG